MSCIDVTIPPTPRPDKIIYVAAAALYDSDGRVLLAEHMKPDYKGMWEFPGGRIEEGELPEECLVRELREELMVETSVSCLSPLGFASYTYPKFHLVMLLFAVRQWQAMGQGQGGLQVVQPAEGQRVQWVRPSAMRNENLLAADIPLIDLL